MKGYKALDKDMKEVFGNSMQFELGKKYTVNGEAISCQNGFHFCKNIEYLDSFYDINNSRIFEIEAYGDIKKSNKKYVAEGIQLVRELSKEEINDYFKQNQKKFIENKDWQVREAVAKQGYGLDTLIHDEKWQVRIAVAEQNYGLDTLIHDEYWEVRKAVAEQGYGLDILINDEDWYIRSVAQRMLECNISEY